MQISTEEINKLRSGVKENRRPEQLGLMDAPIDLSKMPGIGVSAAEVEELKALIEALPDVREDRVAELKRQIENGTYHVSSNEIADLMMRRALADRAGH